jgi:hypothetical protein
VHCVSKGVCLALVGRKGWERRFAGGIMYVIGAVVVVASWKTRICTNVLYARAYQLFSGGVFMC